MTPQALRDHVRILGWCFIVYSAVLALIGMVAGAIVLTGGAISGEREAMLITGAVGLLIAGFLLLVSLPGLLVGWGLLRLRSWARILGIIFGALHLLSIPFGTALGIYAMVILLNEDARALFDNPRV
ncbi:MAG: hypothetical protein ABIP63_00730 [Thermoanaerobaculia bacterium]